MKQTPEAKLRNFACAICGELPDARGMYQHWKDKHPDYAQHVRGPNISICATCGRRSGSNYREVAYHIQVHHGDNLAMPGMPEGEYGLLLGKWPLFTEWIAQFDKPLSDFVTRYCYFEKLVNNNSTGMMVKIEPGGNKVFFEETGRFPSIDQRLSVALSCYFQGKYFVPNTDLTDESTLPEPKEEAQRGDPNLDFASGAISIIERLTAEVSLLREDVQSAESRLHDGSQVNQTLQSRIVDAERLLAEDNRRRH